MTVKQIMNKELVSVLPSSTLYEAAQKMKEQKVGSILVVDKGGKLQGIVTDRDIAIAVAADVAREIKDEFQQFIGLEDAFAKYCC